MSIAGVIAAIGAVAALFMLIRVVRAPRIFADGHPWCRKCRFDLFGRPEGSRNCPECGNALSPHGIIHGVAPRGRAVLALLMLIASIAVFDIDNIGIDPTWFYRRKQAYNDYVLHHRSIADLMRGVEGPLTVNWTETNELIRRMRVGGMSDAEFRVIMSRAIQSASASSAWVQFVTEARRTGKISPEEWAQYYRPLVVRTTTAALTIRPKVRRGDGVPVILMWSSPSVVGLAESILQLDEHAAPLPKDRTSDAGYFTLPASAVDGLADGEHQAIADVTLKVYDHLPGSGDRRKDLVGAVPVFTAHVQAKCQWTLLPATQSSVELVSNSDVSVPYVKVVARRYQTDAPDILRVNGFTSAYPRYGLYQAAVRSGSKEFPLEERIYVDTAMQRSFNLSVKCPGVDRGNMQLVLRPDVQAAAATPTITSIDGREIVTPIAFVDDDPTTTVPAR